MRLIVSLWIVLTLLLLIPSWLYHNTLNREMLAYSKENAVRQLDIVRWMLSSAESFPDVKHLQQWVVGTSQFMHFRITYVAEGGRVIADSDIPFEQIGSMENFYTRPEILQARDQELGLIIRTSRVDKNEYIYVARKVAPKGDVPPGIIRAAAPLSNVAELLSRQQNLLFAGLTLILLAVAFMSYILTRELNSSIRSIVEAAEAIGKGDFRQRLRFSPGHEFHPIANAVNQMTAKVDKTIQDISEQNRQLEAVFSRMHEGVMVLDSRGKVQSVNRAMSTLISKAVKPVGRRPLELFMNLELQGACDHVLEAKSGFEETPYRLQVVLGGERIYDVSIVRVRDSQREIGAVVVFHDISEIRRLEKVREDFVANVSHELSTPLATIKGYAATLLTEARHDPDALSSFVQSILKNTDHMVKMVDDLLQLARLQALEKPVKPVAVDAAEAFQAAWRACAPMAEAKEIRLVDGLSDRGSRVAADFDLLVQVFRNLVENGIRYSPAGGELAVFFEDRGDRVTFGVRDEGPGITKPHQQRIFERFYRVERDRSASFGSTGLGLAICRHIIRNHGGTIWVQSPNEGEAAGSTFFFSLSHADDDQKTEESKTR